MGTSKKDHLMGKLDLLVLRILACGDSMHGYAIAERIEQLSENVLRASDVVLVPLIPTVLSVRTFDQLSGFVAELKGAKPVLRGYFSMLDRRRKLHLEILASLPAERSQMSAIAIPSASAVEQMAVRRSPVVAFAPQSQAASAFKALWVEVAALID